jgi:hypothetical protein
MERSARREQRLKITEFVRWAKKADAPLQSTILDVLLSQGVIGILVAGLIQSPDEEHYPWCLLADRYARNSFETHITSAIEQLHQRQVIITLKHWQQQELATA